MAEDSKLKIDSMMVMILVSVRCRSKALYMRRSFRSLWQKPNLQTSREYTNYLLSVEDRYRSRGYDRGHEVEHKQVKIIEDRRQNITCWNCNQKDHLQNQCSKLIASRDKEVKQAARDSDDALVCCVENTVIMNSGASFHAIYCKEELERFKPSSSKTLKDVRYIPGLKRRLISVGQLDEEGYLVCFRDQQSKATKGSLVVARRNKRGSLYMVDVHPKGIGAIINGSGSAAVCMKATWFGEAKEFSHHNVSKDKETAEVRASSYRRSYGRIVMLKMVSETPLQFGVAKRLSQTFRAESMGLRAEALKILWADSVTTTYLIYHIPYILTGLRIPEEEWRGKDTSLAHLKAVAQMKCDTAFRIRRVIRLSEAEILHLWTRFMKPKIAANSSSLTNPIQKCQVVLVDILENLVENDSIVVEHGLSSEITQSLGRSSDTSKGSENNENFEDSKRPDEEYSEDKASFKEGGSDTTQVWRSTTESKASVRYSSSANYLLLTENGEPKFYSEALSSKESVQWKKAINEEMVPLERNQTCSLFRLPSGKKASQRLWMFKVKEELNSSEWVLIFVEDSWNEGPCRDVYQVGDEREVEVLRNFNWPLSELITNDGVLPVRGAIYRTEIKMRKVDCVGSGDVGIWMWGPTWIGDRISHVVNKKSQVVQCNW
ncbi:retrovirus-related pol polyprotein from transposon TNT 1-94 [Tanacetum coccineum]